MRKIEEIQKFPTLYTDVHRGDCHESLLRSYQILEKVKDLLRIETPPTVILEVIKECERDLARCDRPHADDPHVLETIKQMMKEGKKK